MYFGSVFIKPNNNIYNINLHGEKNTVTFFIHI